MKQSSNQIDNKYWSADGIPFSIKVASRRTISVIVRADGVVEVRAPRAVEYARVEAFVNQHTKWIARQVDLRLAEMEEFSIFMQGSAILLLGQSVPIQYGAVKSAVLGECLILPMVCREQQELKERSLVKFLKNHSLTMFKTIMDQISEQTGLAYRSLRITSARAKWASCNARSEILCSYRMLCLPRELIDYVCVHELCHTVYLNHSKTFWKEVEKHCPNYTILRRKLKRYSWIQTLHPKQVERE